MKLFNHISKDINYEDIVQLDGAFSAVHLGYQKKLSFNKKQLKDIKEKHRLIRNSQENDYSWTRKFDGVEKDFSKEENIELWKNYWLEYVNAFNTISEILPNSVVTLFIGRHAIELGIKYLLSLKGEKEIYTHDLGELSKKLVKIYNIKETYLAPVCEYCTLYTSYIEGDYVEYFRYPNYLKKKQKEYFAGNNLDGSWIIYNTAIVLLKLIHLADLENEFE